MNKLTLDEPAIKPNSNETVSVTIPATDCFTILSQFRSHISESVSDFDDRID